MSGADELVLLHGRLVDGALDEAGRVRLQTLLADPGLRLRFAQLVRVDGGLCEIHGVPVAARRRSAWRGRLLALAACAALALGAIVWLARESAPLATWLDDAARPPPTAAAPAAVGPGRLRLADGSRLELDADCRASLSADGGVLLQRGRLRAVVTPQAPGSRLVVQTAQAEVRVLGTVFQVQADATGTEVGVERGLVEVAPLGRPARQLAAGTAVLVPPQGPLQPVPAPGWSSDLGDAAARAGWTGTPRGDGLLVAFDAVVSEQYKVPTWNLQMADPGVLGIAAFDAQAELRWEVSLARATEVAINVQTWTRDGSAWQGTVQRQERLPAGRQTLVWPLRSFAPRQGAALAAMQGMPIRKLILVAWDGEAAVTAHRFALGRPLSE